MNSHIEKINLSKAQFISNMSPDNFKEAIYKDDEVTQEGSRLECDTYINMLKSWVDDMLKNKCKKIVSYKYSKNLKDHGRQYVKKFGIQSLQSDIRGFLCDGIYNDYDMINCHPTLLLNIKDRLDIKIETPFLKKYVENRSDVLKTGIKKTDILISMNSSTKINSNNEFLKSIDNEFKTLQELVYNCNNDFFNNISKKLLKKDNKKGSFLNRCMCYLENLILTDARNKLNKDKLGSQMFDGFFYECTEDIDDTIKILNDSTSKYGIKWINKPNSKKLNELYETTPVPEYKSPYEDMRKEFENTHLMIEEPLTYIKERRNTGNDRTSYFSYNKGDFRDITATFNLDDKPFLDHWIKDNKKRCYKKIIFDPSTKHNSNNCYNIFNGFQADSYYNDIENEEVIDRFLTHLSNLCSGDQEASKYLLNYICHLFQIPGELPGVSVVICGLKGCGKDLLIDYIEKIIGLEYVTRTQNFNTLFGEFNLAVKNKLVIQINEVSGKDGYKMKEEIKDFITKTNLNINEKNMKQYSLNNYSRVFMMSNNNNPIEITQDNRRFFVINCDKIQDEDYYSNLYEDMNNKNSLRILYEFLKNHCIQDFKIKKPPVTKKMMTMTEHNLDPIYYFLEQYLYDSVKFIKDDDELSGNDGEQAEQGEEKELEELTFITNIDFMNNYKKYCVKNSIKDENINFKSFKSKLVNLDTDCIYFKRKSGNRRGYEINNFKLKQKIDKLIIN